MELLLWRWSTTAQITSALLIAVFFFVLGRSMHRVELRPWVHAWLINLGALLVTIIFWFAQPDSQLAFILLRGGYLFTKTMFVVLLAAGAWRFSRGREVPPALRRGVIAIVAFYAVIGSFVFDDINRIGTAQSVVIALALGTGAVLLLTSNLPASGWLAAGFAARALLAAVEALAHATRLFPGDWSNVDGIGLFLAAYSSLDTGAEWVIALGCVLTLYRKIQLELTQSNAELLEAKEALQQLVDRDPLTGLANRRALPILYREIDDTGATILFFDLNDFKQINDSYGHPTGDDCLKRFAAALHAVFRPEDHVIRYAGDEFVVIAPAADPRDIEARLHTLRDRLKVDRTPGPPIRFSVGQAVVPPHGDAEAALHERTKRCTGIKRRSRAGLGDGDVVRCRLSVICQSSASG
ncbi:MAG TPA: GGDEF domain-containing protein [Thermoanaerobaculia bacterium]|nr:GGDEF domain-containing protein [Thermoanaerobaculia bacterium]